MAYLTLPDTHFTFRYKNSGNGDTISKQKNDAFDEYGGGFSGSATTPLGWALGMPWIGSVHGYWSSIDDSNRNRCVTTNSSTCAAADIVDTPGSSTVSTSGTLFSHTDRDVDTWGVHHAQPAADDPAWHHEEHALGRGLRRARPRPGSPYQGQHRGRRRAVQMKSTRGRRRAVQLQRDARYHLLRRLFRARRRVFDEVTFIGGVKFETRKQFSPRTSLSLLREYEWYSYAPEMRYNDGDGKANGIVNGTHIIDGDAFSQRTSLRFKIGLGPAQLYAPR